MGFEHCTAAEKVQIESEYFFKQIESDINSGRNDDEMKERCKLEVKINNISSGSCKVILNQYLVIDQSFYEVVKYSEILEVL